MEGNAFLLHPKKKFNLINETKFYAGVQKK